MSQPTVSTYRTVPALGTHKIDANIIFDEHDYTHSEAMDIFNG